MTQSGVVVRIKGEDVCVRMAHEKFQEKRIICHIFAVDFERGPADFPLIRELRIQNQKLMRMIYQEPELTSSLDSSVKKTRKEAGQRVARIGRQFRKVMQLFDRALKEDCQAECRRLGARIITNADFQKIKIELNKYIAGEVREFKRKVIEDRLPEWLASKAS